MRVLIVRPEPGNGVTAATVRALGHAALCAPLFEIAPVAWQAPDASAFDAVAMTSANAARHGGADLALYRHLPLFAVGDVTAAAARRAGFTDIRVSHGDAATLGETLSGKVLHLAGAHYRPIPTEASVTVRTVYAATPIDPKQPLDADVALVHSPWAGARLAALVPSRNTLKIIAISETAAHACGDGWCQVHIAANPNDDAMLECLARLCEAGAVQPESPVA